MLVERPKDPMKAEQEKRLAKASGKEVRAISTIGGQGGSLMSFTEGARVMSGR